MLNIVSVWPNKTGLTGINPSNLEDVELKPFAKGFMFEEAAQEEALAGSVQLMVGLRPEDLKWPSDEPVEPVAAKPVEPVEPVAAKPVIPNKKKGRSRKKKPSTDMLD